MGKETALTATAPRPARAAPEEITGRIFSSLIDAMEIFCIYVGDQLGFYRALHEAGPVTAGELAARAGTNERYTREWLEQQATAGYLAVDNPEAVAGERRFRLPDGYEAVFVDPESLIGGASMAQILAGTVAPVSRLLDAFRTGDGVPYADYGRDLHEGQARVNRPALTHLLAQEWIAAMPDLDARLRD